jgi:NAD(P)-dependent dehydrogenase (short-subunit alcohol dehydrogenase family)
MISRVSVSFIIMRSRPPSTFPLVGAGPQGIRANLVCLGFIDTQMHHRARRLIGDDWYDKVLQQRVNTRRAGRLEEIAFQVRQS